MATASAVEPGEAVNGYRVLEEVVRLPVSSWRYNWDPPEVRHLGPMAQDWWAAFGLGGSDTTICSTDANGVALVAIQALHRELVDLRQEVAVLREQVSHTGSDSASTSSSTSV
ncbi:tail fiber domain-containing protein [Streptomyces sp. NPDC127051]|uniref:tail fiber domain-containing protein n=1 Tax=Streptomyces sp. NPDC127051 TaxID=3347119 RepID=UPI00365874FE